MARLEETLIDHKRSEDSDLIYVLQSTYTHDDYWNEIKVFFALGKMVAFVPHKFLGNLGWYSNERNKAGFGCFYFGSYYELKDSDLSFLDEKGISYSVLTSRIRTSILCTLL